MPIKSGVPQHTYRDYYFDDYHWADPQSPTHDAMMAHCSHLCLNIKGTTYVVWDKIQERWFEVRGTTNALNQLCGLYSGLTNVGGAHLQFGRDVFSKYLREHCPTVAGEVSVPLRWRTGLYNGQRCINSFANDILAPNTQHIPLTEDFLVLVRNSVCGVGGPRIDLTEMLRELRDPTSNKEFRFLMNWLAQIYQNPGINLQTNIWLKGKAKGVGKGTLHRVLKCIFGSSHRKINGEDMERGFNEWLRGSIIIEADEFKGSNHKDLETIIKRDTTNEHVTIMQKGRDSFTIPNTANWIFTTNEECPLRLEKDDRRNVFIRTTEDVETWRPYAINLNNNLLANSLIDVAAGFAAILESIQVDTKLISVAYETAEVTSMTQASATPVQYFLDQYSGAPRERWINSQVLFSDFYQPFYKEFFPQTRINNITQFGLRIKEEVTVWTEDGDPPRDGKHYMREGRHVQYWLGGIQTAEDDQTTAKLQLIKKLGRND